MFVYVCLVSYICHIVSVRTSMFFYSPKGKKYINSFFSSITNKTKSSKFRICFKTESVVKAVVFIRLLISAKSLLICIGYLATNMASSCEFRVYSMFHAFRGLVMPSEISMTK